MSESAPVHVAVAVIYRRSDHSVLLALRPQHLHQGGLWEFPGGKLETDETLQQALLRELLEELAIEAEQFRPLMRVSHHYPDKSVLLDVCLVESFRGEPRGSEGQQIRWVPVAALDDYAFPAANQPIVAALQRELLAAAQNSRSPDSTSS